MIFPGGRCVADPWGVLHRRYNDAGLQGEH